MAEDLRVRPVSSEAARAEIERTRAQLSETIEEIEETILRTRDDLRRKLDVLGRVREKPLESVGVALVAGLVLGLLTGGGKKRSAADRELARKAEHWEARARRLLEIARDQEEEIADLRAVLDEALLALESGSDEDDAEYEEYGDEQEGEPSWLAGMKDSLGKRIEELAAIATTTIMDAFGRPPKRKRRR